jgi:hypothetical protein
MRQRFSSGASNSKSTRSTPSKLSTPFSHTTATTSSKKAKGKRTHQDAFADENKSEAMVLASMASDKHTRKMAEHEQRMAELGIKKQRMDLEAKGKHLEAEERLAAARFQREREKELHDLEMLRLRLQYQGGSGVAGVASIPGEPAATAQFSTDPFPETNAFGNLGMGLDGNYLM